MFDVTLRRKDNNLVIYWTIFPESTLDFATARQMLFCSQIRSLRMPKLLRRMLNRNVREDYNFLDEKVAKEPYF